jgi:hypothetical protein
VRVLAVAVVMLAVVASPASARSRVTGTALVVTTCPVERLGEDCGPRPLPGLHLRFRAARKPAVAATTDGHGRYRVLLGRGRYAVTVAGRPRLRCLDTLLVPGRRHVDLRFDNGLR